MSVNYEERIICCLLKDDTCISDIDNYITENDFLNNFNRDVFIEIKKLISKKIRPDVVSVGRYLLKSYPDAYDNLREMYRLTVAVISEIRMYATELKKNSFVKNAVTLAYRIITLAKTETEESIREIENIALSLSQQVDITNPNEMRNGLDILKELISDIEERRLNQSGITGLATNFVVLDKITQGLHCGDLIILAGRPGMGKTMLAMNVASNVMLQDKFVAVFSLEMSQKQVLERLLANITNIDSMRLKTGMLNQDEYEKISLLLSDHRLIKIKTSDKSYIDVGYIRSQCRRLQREHELSLVVIDYLTLLAGQGENETLRIGKITRDLKILARELSVPIILISQLNRAVENRQGKKPTMADLRQSGAIEQDADLILLIYRKAEIKDGVTELIIAKHRNGETGSVYLKFNPRYFRFDNMPEGYEPPEETPEESRKVKSPKDYRY